MNDSIARRLEHVKKKLKLTSRAIADVCGVHPSTVDNYVSGKRTPDADFLEAFCRGYNVNPTWLILGEGAPFLGEEEFVYIPRVGVRLGAGGEVELFDAEPKEVYAFRRDWLLQRGNPKNMRLARVMGDSMEPTLSDGDLVLIDLSKNEPTQEGIYAVRIYNGLAVKRIQRISRDTIRIISDNPKYPAEEKSLENEDFEIVGKVIWVGRSL